MANGIEPKSFEHVRPPRAPKYPDLDRMRNFHTAASSPKKGSSVFGAWPLTIGGKIAEKPAYVEYRVALEIITALSVDLKTCLKPDR